MWQACPLDPCMIRSVCWLRLLFFDVAVVAGDRVVGKWLQAAWNAGSRCRTLVKDLGDAI